MSKKNKTLVLVLLLAVVLLAAVPFLTLKDAEFGGSDDAGSVMVEEIHGEYEPWFTPEMMDTARRLNEYYLFSYGDALRLFTVNKTLKSYEAPKEEWLVVTPAFSVEQFSERKKKQRELAKYLLEVGGASKALLLAKGLPLNLDLKLQRLPLMNCLQKK